MQEVYDSLSIQSLLYNMSTYHIEIIKFSGCHKIAAFISCSSQGFPSEGRNFGRDTHEVDSEEPTLIGHGDLVRHSRILQWAKVYA
jgi:hypothetical protein